MSEQTPLNPPPMPPDEQHVSISDEMERSYLDYAMSVIVSRALPDVRDGLKPVHRRILYAMMEGGYDWSKAYRKSARVVGDVMGNYHPHGDQAIYDAMVRMAQSFSMRVPLVDGQGNFGSVDGDPPAAMRYTESRLAKVAETILRDIDRDTVSFIPNYDETQLEPSVLPAEYPNLLVNGAGGIAVGMATNIAPHNPTEVIDACVAYIQNPAITLPEIMEIIPAPDFPTGGIIMGREGVKSAFETGRGSIIVRAKAEIEESDKHSRIIVHELPYQVNKAQLLERIGEMVRDKSIVGIADLRDESDRRGMRVVVDLKRDAQGDVILNQLFRHTRLQTSFAVNQLVLDNGIPKQMGLLEVIAAFCRFRAEVVTRRTRFLLTKARDRAHVLAGLMVALANLDEIITLIRKAPDAETARQQLTSKNWPAEDVKPFIDLIDDPGHEVIDKHYKLSDGQARAILELRLQRLTGMEREKLAEETGELAEKITEYLSVLSNPDHLTKIILEEFASVREAVGNPRRTEISDQPADQEDEDLIPVEDMVVTVSHRGYIKRVPLSDYRAQRRGGKGRAGMKTRDEDFVTNLFIANTHTPILFFTAKGQVYQLKCYKLPMFSPQAQGKAMVNILPITPDETIQAVMPMPNDPDAWGAMNIIFATAKGNIRRNMLSDFAKIKRNGKIAMKLAEGDSLISVHPCHENNEILMATEKGKAIRYRVDQVRVFKGRNSSGVRGIRLRGEDVVVSMSILDDPEQQYVLAVTENGFGKRTKATDYRLARRGGMGVANIVTSERNGPVVASFLVTEEDQLMLATNKGTVIRIRVQGSEGDIIRVAGRQTQGVTLFSIDEDEQVVSVGLIQEKDDDDDDEVNDAEASIDSGAATPEEVTESTESPESIDEDPAEEGESQDEAEIDSEDSDEI